MACILTQQSMGEISKSLVYFHFFEALNDAFFSELHFYTLSKTLLACRDMRLKTDVFQMKSLLNNHTFNLVKLVSYRIMCANV